MLSLAFQSSTSSGAGGDAVMLFVFLLEVVIAIAIIAGLWKIFTKAGEPGWAAIIPLYNIYILLKIVGRPWWWLLVMLIPCVGVIVGIIVSLDLAKSFGKSAGFAVGLILLGFVFIPILGFGDSKYIGPAARR